MLTGDISPFIFSSPNCLGEPAFTWGIYSSVHTHLCMAPEDAAMAGFTFSTAQSPLGLDYGQGACGRRLAWCRWPDIGDGNLVQGEILQGKALQDPSVFPKHFSVQALKMRRVQRGCRLERSLQPWLPSEQSAHAASPLPLLKLYKALHAEAALAWVQDGRKEARRVGPVGGREERQYRGRSLSK